MIKTASVLLLIGFAVASAAPQQQGRRLFDENQFKGFETTTTPKPIVQIKRLINQQNRDGSYTYGFEAEDGTFKIETRDNLGNVKGKYGYFDANNELKVVDYSAGNGTGFDAQADFLPKPQQPVPLPAAPAPASAPRANSGARFQQARPQAPSAPQPAPQPAPAPAADANGLSHFQDPNGVFQFSFPHPGNPAGPAPAGSFNAGGQYVPSIALEGFSEDADKDGFVDPVPTDGVVPIRANSPRSQSQFSAPAPPPQQFANVDFRGVPAPAPRPQFQQESPRFLPPPQPQQQPIPQRFFDPSAFQQQSQFNPQQQPQFIPQQQPQFLPPPQQPSTRFLQNAHPGAGAPIFHGATESPRFVNPLALQQARRPF